MKSPAQQLGVARSLVWTLALVLFLIAVGEAALRIRQRVKYGAAKPEAPIHSMDPATQLPVVKPGLHHGRIQIDSRGFRNPELRVPKRPSTVRFAFFGGSTTFCKEVSSNNATWPHLVTEALQQQWPRVEVDYVNASYLGFTVETCRRTLELRVRALQPDVIVLYESTNDLSKISHEMAEKQGVFSGKTYKLNILSDYSALWRLVEVNLRILSRERRAVSGAQTLRFQPQELSRPFEDSLSRFVQDARQTAPVVVLITFSHRLRRTQTPEQQLKAAVSSIFFMPYLSIEGFLASFEEYNRVIRDVARRTESVLVDGDEGIPADDLHFTDSVHFTDLGSRRQAERVAAALKSSPAIRQLVEARQKRSSAEGSTPSALDQ